MAGNDVFLWQVPSDANANDVRLRDPNTGVVGYTVAAETGTYTVTGNPASILRGYVLTASSGSYVLTGQTATLTRSRLLTADAGAYGVTGNTANIVYTPTATGYTLTAGSGNYVVSGSNATITFSGGTEMVHGGGIFSQHRQKPHKIPTYEDYLKSTAQEDREYLDKLYKVDEATLEVLNKEAKTLVQIENIYHNTEHDREKLIQALIDEGIAYRDAYLEVYTGLVKEYRQAQEDEAIAAVIAAML